MLSHVNLFLCPVCGHSPGDQAEQSVCDRQGPNQKVSIHATWAANVQGLGWTWLWAI
jgi:hypothetical protein